MDDPEVKRMLFRSAEDDYVARVSALLSLTLLNHWQSVLIRRCFCDGMPPRDCARILWDWMVSPYHPDGGW